MGLEIERLVRADINPASIGAVGAANVDIDVAGLNLGYGVIARPPIALEAGLCPQAAEIVDIGAGALRIRQRITNPSAGAIDGANLTWLWYLVKEE